MPSRSPGSRPRHGSRIVSITKTFWRLEPGQKWLTLWSGAALLASLALRRLLPTRRLFSLARPEEPYFATGAVTAIEGPCVLEQKAALERAARFLGIRNCLVRATALTLLLRQQSIGSTLHIGVRKPSEGALAAHAWVSVGGRIVMGEDQMDRRYTEISTRVQPIVLNQRK
jgi:hypothetical protein